MTTHLHLLNPFVQYELPAKSLIITKDILSIPYTRIVVFKPLTSSLYDIFCDIMMILSNNKKHSKLYFPKIFRERIIHLINVTTTAIMSCTIISTNNDYSYCITNDYFNDTSNFLLNVKKLLMSFNGTFNSIRLIDQLVTKECNNYISTNILGNNCDTNNDTM